MISVNCRSEREYRFEPEGTALLAIDMQQEFFADESAECIDEMRAIVPRVAELLRLARESKWRVIHTRESYRADLGDVHDYRRSLEYVGKPGPLGRFCIIGEPGHEFVEAVKPLADEPVVDKAGFSAFYRSELDELLRRDRVDHLILCGVTTQCCVHSTLREAVDRGYWCLTVADCCAATDAGMHDAALALIAGEGHLFGWVADLQDLVAATGHPR